MQAAIHFDRYAPTSEVAPRTVRSHRWSKLARPFKIKTRIDALGVTYALAVGAVERGKAYLTEYPGGAGYLLAGVCTLAVFMAGGKLLDAVRAEQAQSTAAHN